MSTSMMAGGNDVKRGKDDQIHEFIRSGELSP